MITRDNPLFSICGNNILSLSLSLSAEIALAECLIKRVLSLLRSAMKISEAENTRRADAVKRDSRLTCAIRERERAREKKKNYYRTARGSRQISGLRSAVCSAAFVAEKNAEICDKDTQRCVPFAPR